MSVEIAKTYCLKAKDALDSGDFQRARQYARDARSRSITNAMPVRPREALLKVDAVAKSSSSSASELSNAIRSFLSCV